MVEPDPEQPQSPIGAQAGPPTEIVSAVSVRMNRPVAPGAIVITSVSPESAVKVHCSCGGSPPSELSSSDAASDEAGASTSTASANAAAIVVSRLARIQAAGRPWPRSVRRDTSGLLGPALTMYLQPTLTGTVAGVQDNEAGRSASAFPGGHHATDPQQTPGAETYAPADAKDEDAGHRGDRGVPGPPRRPGRRARPRRARDGRAAGCRDADHARRRGAADHARAADRSQER